MATEKSFDELVAGKIQQVQVLAAAGACKDYQLAAKTVARQKRELARELAREDMSKDIKLALDKREEAANQVAERLAANPALEAIHSPSSFKAKQKEASKTTELQATVEAQAKELKAVLAALAQAKLTPKAEVGAACKSKGNGKSKLAATTL